jgi:hypothetical protein
MRNSITLSAWFGFGGTRYGDVKSGLAESFVEAGKDVAIIAFGADFIFVADVQHVAL